MKKLTATFLVPSFMSGLLVSSSAMATSTTWNIVSSTLTNGGQISGSFVWDPNTAGTNGGTAGTLISNNITLTISGTPYTNLIAASFSGNYIRLVVSQTVGSRGIYFANSALTSAASNVTVSAGYGTCNVVSGLTGLCSNILTSAGGTGQLVLSAATSGPSSTNTSTVLTDNYRRFRSLLSHRSSVMAAMADYDCSSFDDKGYCLSFRARCTGMDVQNEGGGVLTAAYRVTENIRVGSFIDYRMSDTGLTSIKVSSDLPTFGAFLGYAQNSDGTGFQSKLIAAAQNGSATVTREASTSLSTEPGSGKSSLNSYVVSGEIGWGFGIAPAMSVAPFGAVRYTSSMRDSYLEGTVSGTVDYPISYNSYHQRLTTAIAGLRLSGMLTENVGYQLSASVERDLRQQTNTYSGTSSISGLETIALSTDGVNNHTRAVASAGLFYQIDKNQRLTGNVSVRNQAYASQTMLTLMSGYQVAF